VDYYYDDTVDRDKSRPVVQKPEADDQYPNYEVMTHLGDEDTSAYPDYYDRPGKRKSDHPGKAHRKKIGRVEEDSASGDYYDYNDGNSMDQRIRNIRKNEAIFR
jgi:hypothetical protein